MSERGPVGGAGELTAQDVLDAAKRAGVTLTAKITHLAAPACMARALNNLLAAKAPQGVPAMAECICNHGSGMNLSCPVHKPRKAAAPKPAPPPNDVPCPENERSATTAEESGIISAGNSTTTISSGMARYLAELAPAPGAERLREVLETIVAVASGEKQVADDDTAGMAWIDKFTREALAAAPPPPANDHELLVGGVVRVALELAILRGDLRMDNGAAFEEMSESEREDVISDTWMAMHGEGTCEGGLVKELKAIYAALGRDCHASTERVRELEQAIQAINEEYLAYLRGPERVPTVGLITAIGCAKALARRALPPSTGEKS